MRFSCPSCSQMMQCPDDYAGKKATCPKCTQKILVPTPSNPPPPTVSPINKTTLGKIEEDEPVPTHSHQSKLCAKCGLYCNENSAFCPNCGKPMSTSSSPAAAFPNIPTTFDDQGSSTSRHQRAETESNNNLAAIVGLVGASILAVGVFLLVVSAPFIGNMNLFQDGLSIGGALLAIAVVSSILALTRQFRALWLTGISSLILLSYSLTHFIVRISQAKAAMQNAGANEPFAKLGQAMVGAVQLQWGWPLLFIGALAIVASAIIAGGPDFRLVGGQFRQKTKFGSHQREKP